MEIGCNSSSSRASSIASRGSSRPSSASSQQSESSRGSRPRSALTSAYGALRRLVSRTGSRKGSGKSKTDTLYRQDTVTPLSTGSLERGSPLLESDSSISEKLKRQENTRFERPSQSHDKGSTSTSTSHSPVADGSSTTATRSKQENKEQGTRKANPENGIRVNKNMANRQTHRERTDTEQNLSSSSDSIVSDSASEGEILAARGIMLKRKLGEGTYAKVRSAYHTRLHHPGYVAVKIISRGKTNERYQRKFLPRELAILRQIKHKNITRLLEHFEHGQKVFMVMELANQGDLLEYIQRRRVLSDDRARYIFGQILDGVEYLHKNGVFHRDLKCENILLNTGYKVKISDFGFAREWWEAHNFCRTFCGSAAYASPEILQGIPYDPNVADIWSMGVILFIMITGTMPYDDSDVKKMIEIMAHNRLDFPRKRVVCCEVKALLRSILYYYHRERATLGRIRHSPWMRGRCTMPVTVTSDPQTSASAGRVECDMKKTLAAEPTAPTTQLPTSSKPLDT